MTEVIQPVSYDIVDKSKQKFYFNPPKAYPRGVSSYLSTFLSDVGDADERDSGSDSDDSFYSYSARLEHPESSSHSVTAGQIPQSPTTSAQLRTIRQKQSTRKKTKPRQHPKRMGDTDNGRKYSKSVPSGSNLKSRKRSTASINENYHANSPSLKPSVEFYDEKRVGTSEMGVGTSSSPQPQREMRDAATQTSPIPDSNFSTCPVCRSMILSKTEPRLSAGSTITGTIDFQHPSHAKASEIAKHLSERSSITQVEDLIYKDPVIPVSFSDGHKTDSFSSSDALPDDIERLFDRASFSIHVEAPKRSSDSGSDPDGLRKGLSALLGGRISLDNHSSPTNAAPDIDRSPVGSSESQSDQIQNIPFKPTTPMSSLTSISGILFADPFVTPPPPPRASEEPERKTSHSAKLRSDKHRRRISSVQIARGEAPPVPVIPDAFQDSPKPLLSPETHSNGSAFRFTSPNYAQGGIKHEDESTDHMQSSPVAKITYWPSIFEDVNTKSSGTRLDSSTGTFQKSMVSDGGSPSLKQSGTKPNIVDVIHPHSPVQTVKPFPRRFSTRPLDDKQSHLPTDSNQPPRRSISMTHGLPAIDPHVQNYVEARLHGSVDLRPISSTPVRRRSSVWAKLVGSSGSSASSLPSTPEIVSPTEPPRPKGNKLRRKTSRRT